MDQNRSLFRLARLVFFFSISTALLAAETQESIVFEADVMIPMRDGTRLAANIFRPKAEGRFPVILMRSPYGKPDEKWPDAKR
jgi:predicted acyl esterase